MKIFNLMFSHYSVLHSSDFSADEASTSRAGCQNKECKDEKVKISKGELRFGTWIDTERFQSWAWRHW